MTDAGGNAAAPIGNGASWLASPERRTRIARWARNLGALSILAVGVDHMEQYSVDSYSAIPTIGTLFLLNFVSAVPIALGLVAPLRRVSARWANAIRALLALSGLGVAVGSLAGLLISENSGLFGFMERGYREAIVLSVVFEVAAIAFLGVFLVANGIGVTLSDGRIRPR
ncbi:MAG: hypothetical protein QOK25_411 [Thermoleophilaceae bacterium]|nr:hypothetical protein [Thermoleophilaceae bacterium]